MNITTATPEAHTELRDQIGRAINDAIASGAPQADYCDSREIDRLADAVLAVVLSVLADLQQRLATTDSALTVNRKLLAASLRGETPPADPKAPYYVDPAWLEEAPVFDEADLECQIPPFGWRCTRGAGHEGPCAAVECPEDVAAVAAGMARLATAAAPAAPIEAGPTEDAPGAQPEPCAWMHPDGRVVPAETMVAAQRDGGAMLSSLRGYTIALFAQRTTSAAPECDECHGEGIVGVELNEYQACAACQNITEDGAESTSAADSEDAARYRWLRDVHIGDDPALINIEVGRTGQRMDAAIDAARKAGA